MAETINTLLKEHTAQIEWDHQELITLLHQWAAHLNQELALKIEVPAIQIDRLRIRTMAHYRRGRNGFGLKHEIAFNDIYTRRQLAEQLETLLHELLHEQQGMYGRSGRRNYHNLAFRRAALSYGLIINERGQSLGVVPGRFTELLTQHGVDLTPVLQPQFTVSRQIRDSSKLKKWACDCTNVRVAVELHAQCLRCGKPFLRV